jgi:succinate dehydrogenase / fumarate reductase cytochrome b subunit
MGAMHAPPGRCSICEGVLKVSAQERETANVGAGLWKGIGMWAWILFRISGLVLAAYLFVHIWVISQGRVSGASTLNSFFSTFDKPFLVFLDSVLVAAVLYHALNGVRVLLMDLGVGITRHKAVFWICMLIAAAAVWGFAYKAIPFIF